MAGNESTIGALLDETGGSIKTGPFGTKLKASEYTPTGVPVISVGEVGFGRLRVHHDTPRVDETVSSRMPEFLLNAGDIVFGRKGAVERSAQVQPDEDGYFLGSDGIRIRLNVEECDPKFISYQLQTPAHRSWMIQHAAGTTMPSLNEGIIRRIPIVLPPIAEQKAIAAVLGALDDKIELNRRMNATLEAMARALFQSWFVDFDPVRAKLDGREPFWLDPDTAALFPDTFQDSELCRIPNGWTLGRVVDASDFSRSSISPGGFPDETFDHYSLPAFDEGRTPKAEFGGAIMSNKLVVTRDSILLSKLNPHIPRIWLPDLHATRRSVCSTEFIVATPRVGYSREFLFSLFTSAAFASSYCTLVTGTTGSHQRIRPESVLDMNTVIPPPQLVEVFTAVAKPMLDQINRNIDQSRILASLRDTLLPSLLSGELSIN
jgi:type I restriction enzyme, S subunit